MSKHTAWFEGDLGEIKLDAIGDWSVDKIRILTQYIGPYTRIMSRQTRLSHAYVDAFSGAGMHVHKSTGEILKGSPLAVLELEPPFDKYYFIDKDGTKVALLRDETDDRSNVTVLEGDCNQVLMKEVLPNLKWDDFRRGICFLDPYGLHVNWSVISEIAGMRSLELFLNFPLMDINRNVVRNCRDQIDCLHLERMNRFWGDEDWLQLLYQPQSDLFEADRDERVERAATVLVPAYREKLRDAGFMYIPKPIAIRGDTGAILYYLYFASHNSTGSKIVDHIFKSYNAGRLS